MLARQLAIGKGPASLVSYLYGPGRANEHTDQRMIAGSDQLMAMAGALNMREDAQARSALAREFDAAWRQVRRENGLALWPEQGEKVRGAQRGDRVFHAMIALREDEGPLSDEQWAVAAREFVKEMGFVDSEDGADCAWMAINHGDSKNGNDHIHVAVNLVRADGRRANVHQSKVRTASAGAKLAAKLDKEVVFEEGVSSGIGHVPRAEHERAEREGRDADRRLVRRRLAGASWQVGSEAEFVRAARAAALLVRPRYEEGGLVKVTGYSVALEDSDKAIWFAPSRLDKNLGLRALREANGWGVDAQMEALAVWRQEVPRKQEGDHMEVPGSGIGVERGGDGMDVSAEDRAERQRAQREKRAAEKPQVRDRLVGAAAEAGNEAEFVRATRAAGLLVRPRYDEGGLVKVTGYSVALAGEGDPAWFAASKLDKDLGLRALREANGWGVDAQMAAVPVWREGARSRHGGDHLRLPVEDEIKRVRVSLTRDHSEIRWRPAAAEASKILGAWSASAEGPSGGYLGKASDALSKASQPPHRASARRVTEAAVTVGVVAAAASKNDTTARLAVLIQVMKLAEATARAADAERELGRAREVYQHAVAPLNVEARLVRYGRDQERFEQLQRLNPEAAEAARVAGGPTGSIPRGVDYAMLEPQTVTALRGDTHRTDTVHKTPSSPARARQTHVDRDEGYER